MVTSGVMVTSMTGREVITNKGAMDRKAVHITMNISLPVMREETLPVLVTGSQVMVAAKKTTGSVILTTTKIGTTATALVTAALRSSVDRKVMVAEVAMEIRSKATIIMIITTTGPATRDKVAIAAIRHITAGRKTSGKMINTIHPGWVIGADTKAGPAIQIMTRINESLISFVKESSRSNAGTLFI